MSAACTVRVDVRADGITVVMLARPERLNVMSRISIAEAEQILLNAPASVQLTKQGMWIALETPSFSASVEFENRQQVITALTEDGPEAISAFLAKRTPVFAHR